VCVVTQREDSSRYIAYIDVPTSDMPQMAQELESNRITVRTGSRDGSTVFSRVDSISRVESSNTAQTGNDSRILRFGVDGKYNFTGMRERR
jgi:hypothetical protein